jgi:hypothetical protein
MLVVLPCSGVAFSQFIDHDLLLIRGLVQLLHGTVHLIESLFILFYFIILYYIILYYIILYFIISH